MKKLVLACLVSVTTLFSMASHAALITSADIESVSVTGPAQWSFLNINELFNGSVETKAPSTRFIGFRNGGAEPNAAAPISIAVTFSSLFDINVFSFFNDWGNNFEQQVSAITIFGFDMNGNATGSNTFTGLQTNSFAASTFSGSDVSALKGVKSLAINITATQGGNLEIRELQFDASAIAPTAVNAPATLGLFGLALGALLLRRKAK
ncbi:MYXO-CTERM sorting domain-containing protein [Alteromonas oceanisediminis]|uniref:MYXO-CTERM sorting domain-containing protein n=1 Tax=Alteromonas oceanisediminis TaxID=2836180 RepID=UPI001BDAFE17|nr:MYXO-CTERM sorting domain-containing protein [Alteromonas oceanisediminis]MBT0585309.1 PEP-CTERM sorting domain-containing protein [Alteromonas oceanisediminis]